MFERFTARARRAVVLAQEEARMLGHNYIGTEHLLLGLIHEGTSIAAEALETLGISLEDVRSQVEEIIGQGQERATGHIPWTPRGKKVLELSLREALQLGHNYIGTEHILLGLVREGEGVAAQVLVKRGCELTRVRQQVLQILSGYQKVQPEPVRAQPPKPEPTKSQPDAFARRLQGFIDTRDGVQTQITDLRLEIDAVQKHRGLLEKTEVNYGFTLSLATLQAELQLASLDSELQAMQSVSTSLDELIGVLQ